MNSIARFIFIVIVSIPFATPFAKAEDCETQGTWKGTIGDIPITLELVRTYDYRDVGRYYYRDNIDELFIAFDVDTDGWLEQDATGKKTGKITEINCKDSTLTAVWSSLDGNKTFPIKAYTTVNYRTDWKPTSKLLVKNKRFKKYVYQEVTTEDKQSSTVKLAGNTDAIKKINASVMNSLTQTISESLECKSNGNLESVGSNWYSTIKHSIIDWNNRFVVIGNSGDGYCGGAHGNFWSGADIFNLITGDKENTTLWLNTNLANKASKQLERDSNFGKLLFSAYAAQRKKAAKSKEDLEMVNECVEVLSFYPDSPWVTNKGFYFQPSTSYADSVCIDDVLISFKHMRPFLSEQGKAAIKAFENSR